MWRWTRRILVGLIGLFLLAAAAGATYQWVATRRDLASTPAPGQLVDVGGHRLHLWCTGAGAPPVILEAGLGGSTADWGFVQPEIARFTRVCSYDRAGMGYSDSGPSARTARRIAEELGKLIDRSGLDGPVVLVAASSGGFGVRVFASDHTDRVAGLVLVDASQAMRAKVQGTVELEAVVLPNGVVGEIRVVKSLDRFLGLDARAITAAREWLFAPGRDREGRPVAVIVTLIIEFRIH